jgi:GWxTD domain-containing protein
VERNIFYVMLVLVFTTCKTNHQYTSKPTKSLINPDSDLLEVNALAYHLNDTVTAAYVEIKNENLLYKHTDTSMAFYAEIKISYKLLWEQNGRKILDSSAYYMIDRAGEESVELKSLISKFNLKARRNNNYYLEIEVLDLNKKTRYTKGLNIYKKSNVSGQNFLVSTGNNVAFKNNFLRGEQLNIKFSNLDVYRLTVDCFFKEFGPALPPFSIKEVDELKYKPDSVFELDLNNNMFSITMPAKGFLHIKPDARSNEGLTVFTYDKTFPGVSNNEEMINCTRYIMSREEFDACKNASEQKAAIDKFWLGIGGSNERAREVLKRYYGRVKETNKYYSSYLEGWKSDRGMIFIVFGHPANVYRSKKDEIWVYGNEANPGALRFIFNKTQNPFSDNDFILERSTFYKGAWQNAVEAWRQGNVYFDRGR